MLLDIRKILMHLDPLGCNLITLNNISNITNLVYPVAYDPDLGIEFDPTLVIEYEAYRIYIHFKINGRYILYKEACAFDRDLKVCRERIDSETGRELGKVAYYYWGWYDRARLNKYLKERGNLCIGLKGTK